MICPVLPFPGPLSRDRTSHLCHGDFAAAKNCSVAQRRGFSRGVCAGSTRVPADDRATSALFEEVHPPCPRTPTFLAIAVRSTKTRKLAIAGVATARCRRPRVLAGAGRSAQTTTETRLRGSGGVQPGADPGRRRPSVTDQLAGATVKAEAIAAKKKAADAGRREEGRGEGRGQKKAAPPKAASEGRAARKAKEAASRSAQRATIKKAAAKTLPEQPRRLDPRVPGHHEEAKASRAPTTACTATSCGSPRATRTPSTTGTSTPSTASRRRVCSRSSRRPSTRTTSPGTSWNIYDPVANITAAAQLRGRQVRLDRQRQQRVLRPARTSDSYTREGRHPCGVPPFAVVHGPGRGATCA